jgi:hypothetical protein
LPPLAFTTAIRSATSSFGNVASFWARADSFLVMPMPARVGSERGSSWDLLIKQDDILKEQIDRKQSLTEAAGKQATAEGAVTDQYAKQLSIVKQLSQAGSGGGGGGPVEPTVTVDQLQHALDAAKAQYDVAKTAVFDKNYGSNYDAAYQRVQTLTTALQKAKFIGQSIGSGYGEVKVSDLDLSGLTLDPRSYYAPPGSFDYRLPTGQSSGHYLPSGSPLWTVRNARRSTTSSRISLDRWIDRPRPPKPAASNLSSTTSSDRSINSRQR